MKSYKNKKVYNFKKKHLRKRRTRCCYFRFEKLGGSYTKEMQQKFRVESKEVLRQRLKGRIIEFPLYKKTMSWDF